jgi:cytochrome c peroxidase
MRSRVSALSAACVLALAMTQWGGARAETPFYANTFEKVPSAAALTRLGRLLFYDVALSASGSTSCATCHDPQHAFAPANDLPVQRGGSDGRRPGIRAVPSLLYAQNVPPFTEHYFDDEGDDGIDQGPAGGRTWDGRAQSAHEQARLPLFSPFEMANVNEAAVVAKVRQASYAAQLRETFGSRVFDDPASAFKAVLMSLETFQQSAAEFYPYSSKYDAWLRGKAALNGQEMRGLDTFNAAGKGNCARCHPSAVRNGAFPQFTDFGYAALGVPRNRDIPANADKTYYDLGLCGPVRTDLAQRNEYCGLFRTPTLRNVASRRVFFHNGAVRSLDDAVRFYAERDSRPQDWYRQDSGVPAKFDDLPPQYWANVDSQVPFGQLRGGAAALTAADVADIVAFLKTLSDGYVPPSEAGT